MNNRIIPITLAISDKEQKKRFGRMIANNTMVRFVDDEADVRVLYIARGVGRHERVDNAWVRAKYDVEAAQYADFSTMRGDATLTASTSRHCASKAASTSGWA